jgi:hypothetical protein
MNYTTAGFSMQINNWKNNLKSSISSDIQISTEFPVTFNGLHDVICMKIGFLITTAVRISNSAKKSWFLEEMNYKKDLN